MRNSSGSSLAVSSALGGGSFPTPAFLNRIPSRQRDSAPCAFLRDRFSVASASSSRNATPSGARWSKTRRARSQSATPSCEGVEDGEGYEAVSSDGSSVIDELERTSADSRASLIDYYHETGESLDALTLNLIRYLVLTLSNCIQKTKLRSDSASGVAAYQCLWYLLTVLRPGAYPTSLQISLERALWEISLIEQGDGEGNVDWVELRSNRESVVVIGSDGMKVRNESWTFESAIANHPVCFSADVAGWYYEATVSTSGIMQVGWASQKSIFCPEKGIGVGNSKYSHSFDGGRAQAWNSQPKVHLGGEAYGTRWREGDVISCLLNKAGSVSFWLNGDDLGVAVSGIDSQDEWYPALSLCTEQQCSVNFGYQPFRYEPPDGFKPISFAIASSKLRVVQTGELAASGTKIFQVEDVLESSAFSAAPSIDYFYEITVSQVKETPLLIGFRAFSNNILFSLSWNAQLAGKVVGCGLALSPPAFFLTVEENVKEVHCDVAFSASSHRTVCPIFNVSRLSLNLGQFPFKYEKANGESSRLKVQQNLIKAARIQDSV